MMFMTAKVDLKKILIAVVAAIAAIFLLVSMFGGSDDVSQTATGAVDSNDARVEFLKGFGWEVAASPVESGQVKIPQASSEVYDRYNQLQKSQGYDLSKYAGKTVMRYVYKINNYPGATEPVYATVLVYKNQIIGGDITNTAPGGTVSGFQKAENSLPVQPTEPTVPETT